ncbi:MAG: hypothetical protein ACI4MJ_11090 [Aristaeellaceae bacterium]
MEHRHEPPRQAEGFVIHPEPTAEPPLSQDGMHVGSATPHADAVAPAASAGSIQASSILLCGNVSLVSDAAIEKAAEICQVIVAGRKAMSSGRKARYYQAIPTQEPFAQLFDAYDIDTVWYISGYADGQSGMDNEMKCLERVIQTCVSNAVGKLVVVSSVESMNFHQQYDILGRFTGRTYVSGDALATAQMEDFVRFSAKSYGLKTIVLRTPYIASSLNTGNFLGQIFEHMLHDGKLVFPYCPENKVDFLSENDLIELLLDVSEETADQTASYSVTSGYHYTWRDLEDEIRKLVPDIDVSYTQGMNFISIQSYSIELKRKYGFIPMDNVLDDIGPAFARYRERAQQHSWLKSTLRRVGHTLMSRVAGYLELILFFLLTEFLVAQTGDSAYFKYVDLRLFYIVIMGTTYGTAMGISAGVLTSIALYFQFQHMGINGVMLFYNLENWLPFVVYLMTGSIVGYLSRVRRQELAFLRQEHELLREKYLFLNDVYHGAIQNKSEYKRQILGYKDSFGVIFQAVQRLDSVLPQEIFMNGIRIMEDILKNHTIAIYSLDDYQRYGRLAASSGEILNGLAKSLVISSVLPVYETVKKGDVWKNTGFVPDMPMYAYGIGDHDKIELMIFLYDASPEQMGLYYMNLFSILCNLIKLSFIRALEYQRAIEQEKYYPNTQIVIPAYFAELLTAQRHLMDEGLASYALLRFESRDKQYISDALRGVIRSSDVLGADDEGTLFLMLTQTTRQSAAIVEERLTNKGLNFDIVS